jgi:uncharacterized membrane protein YoaK (UPF0700 family)
MVRESFIEKNRGKMIVALLLTFGSGLVDIVGYVGIFQLFTAHLTGATVQLGQALADRSWTDVRAAVVIITAFVSGSIFGRAVIEAASRKKILRIASVTLAIEAAMLAIVAATAQPTTPQSQALPLNGALNGVYWGLAILACAMGIQTATLTGIGPLTVHTTFVTGMVNKTTQLVSHIAFRTYDLLRSKSPDIGARRARNEQIKQALFLSAIWCFYVGGAAFGAWSYRFWGFRSLFVAVGLLAVGIATDLFWPLAIKEEKEQSER